MHHTGPLLYRVTSSQIFPELPLMLKQTKSNL